MERYEEHKNVEAEWLGKIPATWQAVRMKYLFRDHSEKNKPDEELLSVTQSQGVVPRSWVDSRMVMPSGNLESFKFIREGDFAISLRSFEGGLEYCYHDGIISPAYTVLKLRTDLSAAYYKYLLKSTSFISEIQTSVVGIREGKNISYPELSYSILPIPPLPEQTAIATFLDRKTAAIDRAVAQKERLIELLRERKRIVVQRAVTRGLDEGVEMRDSGVEWIGEIPAHWEVKLFKYIATIRNGQVDPKLPIYKNQILIAPNHIEKGTGRILGLETADQQGAESGKYQFQKDDLIYSKIRPELRKVCLAPTFGLCSADMYAISPTNEVLSEWLLLVFLSEEFNDWMTNQSMRVAMPKVNREDVNNYPILIPPTDEQTEIVEEIKSVSAKTDRAIHHQTQQIAKLREYRSVLIDGAVTGKFRVS